MTEKAHVLEKQFLVSLANRTFRHGRRQMTFRSPLIDTPLVAVDQAFTVSNVIARETFNEERRRVVGKDDVANEEMPHWGDLVQAFQACGALPPRNFPDFLESLERIEREAGLARSLALAVDTNVAYNRLFSRHLDHVKDTSGSFVVMLSKGVRDEIGSHLHGKIRRESLSRLYSSELHAPYVEQLGNRNDLDTRRAMLAQNEVDHLMAKHSPVEAQCGPFEGDKEKFDTEIAKGYVAAAEQQRLDAHMVTFDQLMTPRARNVGMKVLSLELPDTEKAKGASLERAFPALVHDLAVIFGVLIVEPFGIRIWGEWGGKTSEDYGRENVRIEIDSTCPIEEKFARDVDIGKRLIEESAKWM